VKTVGEIKQIFQSDFVAHSKVCVVFFVNAANFFFSFDLTANNTNHSIIFVCFHF
jgi:hypothetical protein